MTTKPLAGIRVLDLGIITAGAATSAMLADLGAEVLKIESPTYADPFRVWVPRRDEDQGKLSPHFRATNRGKRSVAINVKTPEGRACLLRLAARCDVVVENFRRGVMAKLGIGFAELSAANPRIILASISSQGETGPDADYVSYGSTLESMAGMAWLTGYPGEDPMVSGVDLNYPDQVVAIFATGAICTALLARETGPVHLDLSQRELTSFLISDAFEAPLPDNPRIGNADPAWWFQDALQAQDGRWIALSVSEGQQADLRALTGAAEPEAWVSSLPAEKVVRQLGARGIAAAICLPGEAVLAAGDWHSALSFASDGLPLKGTPFTIEGAPPAHTEIGSFGCETAAVLRDYVGYSDKEIAALAEAGVIDLADAPAFAGA
ncbi:MAG: CoA transferase [Rhodobacteraceae bacterium]|jgi:crotonobetainyl-CoA:carnitine CoA-transferase CaiB-like acyl-CoA transferase|nr:CoA transferase [Paracoccaceae bacterium]